MVIIGSWHVALSAIIAYQYEERELHMNPHIDVLLVSRDTISGFVEMETINRILRYMQQSEERR